MSASEEASVDLKFEQGKSGEPTDETDISVRAYVTRIDPDKLAQYQSSWSDVEVKEWDGNFKSDGSLMLVCCERDVEVAEFRSVVEEYIEFLKSKGTE